MTTRTRFNPAPEKNSPAEQVLLDLASEWGHRWTRWTYGMVFPEDWEKCRIARSLANVQEIFVATALDRTIILVDR